MRNVIWKTENGKWKRSRFFMLISDLARKSVRPHHALSLREMPSFVSHQEPKRVEQAVNHHARKGRGNDCLSRFSVLQRSHLLQQFALMGDEAFNDVRINRA